MFVPIWTMPYDEGWSVDVTSSARAHRRQRSTATWTGGRCEESMLCLTEEEEAEEERSESEAEYEEVEDDPR